MLALGKMKRSVRSPQLILFNFSKRVPVITEYIHFNPEEIRQQGLVIKSRISLLPLKGGSRNMVQESLFDADSLAILTKKDWLDFQRKFGKICPGFFARLRLQYPKLTEAEIRLLALTKIGFTNTEKAKILGISPASVRKTRLRLQHKTGRTDEEIILIVR